MTDRTATPPVPGGRLLVVLAVASLVAVDPIGWDRFGPLRFLLVAGAGCWAVARAAEAMTQGRLPTAGPLPRLWLAFLGWGALCSALGADWLHAWLGTPERRFGWLTWLLCAGVFVVAGGQDRDRRRQIILAIAAGGAGLGVYSGLEWLGVATGSGPIWPVADVGFAGGRVGGTFGQPAFLGAAGALAGPVAAGVAADRTEQTRWRVVGGVGAVGGFAAVLTSQSRAALVGVLAAGMIFLVVSAVRSRDDRGHRSGAGRAVAVVMVGLVAVTLAVPRLRQRVTGSLADDGVLAGRTDEWQVGLRALADAPLFGYGPEGYRTVFGAHVDDEYILRWGWEVITDRAHNGLLDVALSFGLPGAVLFGAVVVLASRAAIAGLGSGDSTTIGLGAGVLAYVAQQQFLFPLSELDPLLWLTIGLLTPAPTATRTPPVTPPPVTPPPVKREGSHRVGLEGVGAGVALGVAIVVTLGAGLDVAANVALGSGPDVGDNAGTASRLRPDSIRYRFIEARTARADGDLEDALNLIRSGLDLSPNDPALRGEEGRLVLEVARATPDGPGRVTAVDAARRTLEALVTDSPHNPEHLQRLGVAQAIDGDLPAAIATMEEAARLAPDRPEPQRNLEEFRRLASGS